MATFAYPSGSFGYWRGGGSDGFPLAQGQGSKMGPANAGVGIFPAGSGGGATGSGWTPTVTYLLVFIAAEIVAFGLLARVLR
jgi:hypothetical protein